MQDASTRGAAGDRTRTVRLAALACAVLTMTAGCAWIREVSVAPSGASGNGAADGSRPAVSADGRYVAFGSDATNLVAGADGGLFVRDTSAGTITVASVRSDGSFGWGTDPAISANGRYVAFVSDDPAMVPGLSGGHDQVFVRDRFAKTTRLVSMKATGVPGNDDSEAPSISGDGRIVAYESDASNLVAFDTNASTDVFVRDLQTTASVRINVFPTAEEPFFGGDSPSISADGRYVAFDSLDSLTGEDTPSQDVFVRDRVTNTTQLVSRASAGGLSNGYSEAPRISDTGRFVTFTSTATNLDGLTDTNQSPDVFVRDLTAKTTARISRTANGVTQVGSSSPAISGDGRLVAYVSASPDIVAGDTNGAPDAFVFDRATSLTTRVDTNERGVQAPSGAGQVALSGDGRYVAFVTSSALTPGHSGSFPQFQLRHVVTPTIGVLTPAAVAPGTTTNVVITGSGFLAGTSVVVTGDGLTVGGAKRFSEQILVVSVAASPAASRGARDVYVTDSGTGPGAAAGAVASCPGCLQVG